MLQQLRLLLAAAAHFGKTQLRVAAGGDHVLRADKHRHFAGLQLLAVLFDEVHHDEERRAVLVDLRPLVALLRVFNRELVKAELFLQRRQLRRFGVFQGDPDETVGTSEIARGSR